MPDLGPALPGPALSRAAHDRAGHRRADTAWLAAAWPTARVVLVTPEGLAAVTDDRLVSTAGAQVSGLADHDWARLFLGESHGDAGDEVWFAGVVERGSEAPAGARWANLRDVGATVDDLDAGLFTAAAALVAWHLRNAFCPRCGGATTVENGGWHRRCTVDGTELYPRTDAAVIMLVHDGAGRCVLGRQAVWPAGRFSILAGFVEAGEPFEAAVVREVAEEVGLAVTDVRYVASQPWPFPQSLMIGCTALATSSEIRPADDEIAEAYWFTRAEVAAAGDWDTDARLSSGHHAGEAPGVGPGGVLKGLPGPVSIARQLLDAWVAGTLP